MISLAKQATNKSNPQTKNEKIYDDLSLFLKIFKQILRFIKLLNQNSEYLHQYKERIKICLKELYRISQLYQNSKSIFQSESTTFYRFLNRLKELNIPYCNKKSEQQTYSSIQNFYQKLSNLFEKLKEEKSLLKAVKLLETMVLCEFNNQKDSQRVEVLQHANYITFNTQKIKIANTRKHKYPDSLKIIQNKDECQSQQEVELNLQIEDQLKPEKQNYSHEIQDSRYAIFDCLDIDIAALRLSQIRAKRSLNNFQNIFQKRNYLIQNSLKYYQRCYKSYKTKQYNKNQKTNYPFYLENRSQIKPVQKIFGRDNIFKKNNDASVMTDSQQNQSFDGVNRSIKYKINNLQLMMNSEESNFYHSPVFNIISSSLKKRSLQAQRLLKTECENKLKKKQFIHIKEKLIIDKKNKNLQSKTQFDESQDSQNINSNKIQIQSNQVNNQSHKQFRCKLNSLQKDLIKIDCMKKNNKTNKAFHNFNSFRARLLNNKSMFQKGRQYLFIEEK